MRKLLACERFVEEFGIAGGYDYLLYALAWIFDFVIYRFHPIFGAILFLFWYADFVCLIYDKIRIGGAYLDRGKDAALEEAKVILGKSYRNSFRILFKYPMWLILKPISILLDIALGDYRFLPGGKK